MIKAGGIFIVAPGLALSAQSQQAPGTQASKNATDKSEAASNFKPWATWRDNNGVNIDVHGGGVLLHNDKCYWVSEHKVEGKEGNSAQLGV